MGQFLHLEPKLQLFEVDDHGDAGNDDLSHHHLPGWRYQKLPKVTNWGQNQ